METATVVRKTTGKNNGLATKQPWIQATVIHNKEVSDGLLYGMMEKAIREALSSTWSVIPLSICYSSLTQPTVWTVWILDLIAPAVFLKQEEHKSFYMPHIGFGIISVTVDMQWHKRERNALLKWETCSKGVITCDTLHLIPKSRLVQQAVWKSKEEKWKLYQDKFKQKRKKVEYCWATAKTGLAEQGKWTD